MSETVTKPETGTPTVLAEYKCDEGTRQLVGQRVNGTVHISDVPVGDEGRVHLVEKRIDCLKELDALVADYLQTAHRSGRSRCRRRWTEQTVRQPDQGGADGSTITRPAQRGRADRR